MTTPYLYFRDPVQANIEGRVTQEAQDVVQQEIKTQTYHTVPIEIQNNLKEKSIQNYLGTKLFI